MSSRAPNWEHVETFLAVMQTGSLSAAARTLGVTQPTARRHIEHLEASLGAVLFTRAPTGLIANDTAHRLLVPATDMAATARAMARDAKDGADLAGTVRLTCSEVFGTEILPPLLADLMAAQPGLEFELLPVNDTADLLRRDADLAVRMVPPKQAALVARKVGRAEVGLFATPAYLAGTGIPAGSGDLIFYRLIGEDRGRAIASAAAARGLPPLHFSYRTDSDLAQMAAIRAGVGIGFMQVRLATGLARVLPELAIFLDVWLAMHEDQRGLPRLRMVYDGLAERLQALLRA